MPAQLTSEFWRGKSVLVTGASGFLGGWTVRRLLGLGARVVALVRDDVPGCMLKRDRMATQITMVNGELEDAGLVLRSCTEYEIDTVFHLAAQPIVGVAKLDPVGTFRANIEGTWNVLEAARRAKVKQTIIASSDKAYGDNPNLPYTEDSPLQGRYPYDCSKSCADLIAQTYLATYDMPVSVVRCANLFGGGDLNFNRAIPGAIQATLQGKPFVIRSDGKFVRSFLYVEDAADAYLLLAEAVAGGAPQGAYNFSLEGKVTVLEIVHKILELLDRTDLKPVILNQASGEIREQYMNCDKARKILKWAPSHSLEAGLRKSIEWYRGYREYTTEIAKAAAQH